MGQDTGEPESAGTSEREDRPSETEGAQVLSFPSPRPRSDIRWKDVVGELLREERLEQGRTLADVADAAAVSLPYLSEIERGRKDVSSDLLAAVYESLGLDLAEVVERAARRLRPGTQGDGPVLLAA